MLLQFSVLHPIAVGFEKAGTHGRAKPFTSSRLRSKKTMKVSLVPHNPHVGHNPLTLKIPNTRSDHLKVPHASKSAYDQAFNTWTARKHIRSKLQHRVKSCTQVAILIGLLWSGVPPPLFVFQGIDILQSPGWLLCKLCFSVFPMLIVIKSYSQHTKEMRLCPRETALWKIRILSNTLLLEFKLQNDDSHRISLRASPQESKSCLSCSANCTSSVERKSPRSRDVTSPTLSP